MGHVVVAFPCTIGAMVPVYALMSFLSLVINESATIYFNSISEIYEAWVIYNFLSLCLAWVGGPGAVVISLSGHVLKSNWCLMTCCFPPIPLDGRFIRRYKQGCLQFVILEPILVAVTVLYAKGRYHDGNFSAGQSYLYLTIIYTFSYSLALYALALFYFACRDLLQPFNPAPILTYWQFYPLGEVFLENFIDKILCHLPVKSLLRFRCVAKGWCSRIDSTSFIAKHLKTTLECNSGGGLIIRGGGKFYLSGLDLLEVVEINDPIKFLLVDSVFVGSCNDLCF